MTQQQPEAVQVDPQAVVNALGDEVKRQAVESAMLRAQVAALQAENAQLLGERDALIAAQEANQQAAQRDS